MKKAYEYLDKDPDVNMANLLSWADKFDRSGEYEVQRQVFREILKNPESGGFRLIRSLWSDIDPSVRKHLFETIVINSNFESWPKLEKMRKKHKCNIPWAILMDPTSACNLKCVGCWASEYGNRLNLDLDTLDSIIRQGKALGIAFYLYSGGEPLVRKADILTLCRRYPECTFLAFTNGTLIDEAFAERMLEVKNFIPAISVEGFEAETDARRGAGTFAAVRRAMEILKKHKLPFGVSCCYTSQNTETIGSEAYFDSIIRWGAKFAWFFTYMPVGNDAVPELLATAEQREYMYRQVRKFRETKPLFTMDFWNDGEFVEGCIAGGRRYLHINANGDIEPCAFIHYSNANIKDTTLLEALKSPLFMQYHANQPFNKNDLRPCPLLDNPGRLTSMVTAAGAHSTDLISPEDVRDLSAKCKSAADRWAVTAQRLWEESHPEENRARAE